MPAGPARGQSVRDKDWQTRRRPEQRRIAVQAAQDRLRSDPDTELLIMVSVVMSQLEKTLNVQVLRKLAAVLLSRAMRS